MLSLKPRPFVQSSFDMQAPLCVCVCVCVFSFVYLDMSLFPSTLFFLPFPLFLCMESVRRTFFPSEWCFSTLLVTTGWIFQGSSRYNVLFGTDGDGFQEPRVQMVRGYGFHIITVGTWMVPEKLGLLRSGLRSLVKSAVWLRSGLRFQVKSAGRFRSGLHSTYFFPKYDISHAFNFRHAFTATYQHFYISTSTISPAAAPCADCTSWRHWLRLSRCAAVLLLNLR